VFLAKGRVVTERVSPSVDRVLDVVQDEDGLHDRGGHLHRQVGNGSLRSCFLKSVKANS
jgi:hypothetical protein